MESPFALTWGTHDVADAETYRRIRTRVLRRLHKLRKYLSIQQRNRYTHRSITSEDVASDYKFWLLALLTLERDFVYALEVKSLAQLDTQNTKSKKKLLITRLKRSIQEVQLCGQLAAQFDKTAQLEVAVYAEYIKAQLSMVLQHWDVAIDQLSLSRVGLQFLEEHGNAENVGKYKAVIDSDIDTLLVGAIHMSKNAHSGDIGEVAKQSVSKQSTSTVYKVVAETNESYLVPSGEANLIKELQWRSYSASIKDDSLARLLYKIGNAPLETMERYDDLTSLLSQATETHNLWLQNEVKEEDDEILSSYLQYTTVLTSLRRNVTLLATVRPTAALTLLDKIQQEVVALEEIPGVFNDDDLFESLEGLKNYYSCLKWKILADHHFGGKEYKKSLLLSSKIQESLQTVKLTVEFPFITDEVVQELANKSKDLLITSQILAQITGPSQGSLADNINSANGDKIVDLAIRPISVKPVLFDVAFNYIQGTSAPVGTTPSPTATVSSPETSEEKKKGFFGLFGR